MNQVLELNTALGKTKKTIKQYKNTNNKGKTLNRITLNSRTLRRSLTETCDSEKRIRIAALNQLIGQAPL